MYMKILIFYWTLIEWSIKPLMFLLRILSLIWSLILFLKLDKISNFQEFTKAVTYICTHVHMYVGLQHDSVKQVLKERHIHPLRTIWFSEQLYAIKYLHVILQNSKCWWFFFLLFLKKLSISQTRSKGILVHGTWLTSLTCKWATTK